MSMARDVAALERLKESKEALLQALRDAGTEIGDDLSHLKSPWREDKTGSLSVFKHEGKWFFKDHGEGGKLAKPGTIVDVVARTTGRRELTAVLSALNRYGRFVQAGVPSGASKPKPARRFASLQAAAKFLERILNARCTRQDVYRDARGKDTIAVLRLEKNDGGKTYRPLHRVDGGWVMGDPPGLLPLYNLPTILSADRSKPVVVVEGEKCAERLTSLGFLATTSAHGAKSAKKSDWSPLVGREVIIWPDKDAPGLEYAADVAHALAGVPPSNTARQVDPETLTKLGDGGDVVDFLAKMPAARHKQAVRAVLDTAVVVKVPATGNGEEVLTVFTAAELAKQYPELRPPVVHDLVRRGETMNVIGSPKAGKSWLALDFALAVATGTPFLSKFPTQAGKVLIVDNELHPETCVHRLKVACEVKNIPFEAIAERISFVPLRGNLKDIEALAGSLAALAPRAFDALVLDALYRLFARGTDENSNADLAHFYNVVDKIARSLDAALVLIHHASKGAQGNKSVTDTGAGAGAIARATDTHMVLRSHEASDACVVEARCRTFPPPSPFCVSFEYPRWRLRPDLDPAALAGKRRAKSSASPCGPAPEAWTAERFASSFLTAQPKERPVLLAEAAAQGLSTFKAAQLLNLAIGGGKVFLWSNGHKRPASFATVRPPEGAGNA
ncbi:MAG TPA: AAA family ATPase [Planctomycetota bacterium]|jgi:hypothetical protein